MKIVIVEDETAAALNLQAILKQVRSDMEVTAVLESVTDTVRWFRENPAPDAVFMDIHLADGDAFRIFPQTEIPSPIIFTTAYDQYALEAFKVNSIDYLLKPIKIADLVRALEKLDRFTPREREDYSERLSEMLRKKEEDERTAFLVHVKDKIIPIKAREIDFFYTFNERVTAHTSDGREMPMERSLDSLMGMLPGEDFFRANRQFIVARHAIHDISVWFGSRLCLNLTRKTPERIIISKVRVPELKKWLKGE